MTETITEIILQIGQFHFGGGQTRLRTLLGSCVAFTFWHPIMHIGGMCHYLLPKPVPQKPLENNPAGLYATHAIALFEESICRSRTQKGDYVVRVIGGGNMFPEHAARSPCVHECTLHKRAACRDIACRNVTWGRELLVQHGFTIASEDVGGAGSRSLTFDLWSGEVTVRRGPTIGGLRAAV